MCSSCTCLPFEQHVFPCMHPHPKFKLHARTASSRQKPNGHGRTGERIKSPPPEAKPRETLETGERSQGVLLASTRWPRETSVLERRTCVTERVGMPST